MSIKNIEYKIEDEVPYCGEEDIEAIFTNVDSTITTVILNNGNQIVYKREGSSYSRREYTSAEIDADPRP